eukprot:360659-Chlamydomonas_euryale.AAC.1
MCGCVGAWVSGWVSDWVVETETLIARPQSGMRVRFGGVTLPDVQNAREVLQCDDECEVQSSEVRQSGGEGRGEGGQPSSSLECHGIIRRQNVLRGVVDAPAPVGAAASIPLSSQGCEGPGACWRVKIQGFA